MRRRSRRSLRNSSARQAGKVFDDDVFCDAHGIHRVKAVRTLKIALPPLSQDSRKSTTIISTASSDGRVRIYDIAVLPTEVPVEITQLEPVAEYDTKGSRLTCMTVADGDVVLSVVNGKRKRKEVDEDEDDDAMNEDEDQDEDEAKDDDEELPPGQDEGADGDETEDDEKVGEAEEQENEDEEEGVDELEEE